MKKKFQKTALSNYPSQTFLKTENGYFYVISSTKRYRFTTYRCLMSWAPQRIVEVSEEESAVKRMKVSSKMKFRNGSLLYSQANGKMYLISDNKLRHITSPDILTGLGVKRQDAVWVSEAEINLHEEGETLS